MKLYFSPGSCALGPNIALHEAGLPVTLVKVDLATKQIEGGGDLHDINPRGAVPVLELDNGEILTQSAAILQYIADLAPDAKLIPPLGTTERYQTIRWLTFISADVHKDFSVLFGQGASPEFKKIVRDRLVDLFGDVDKALEGRDWLVGDNITIADIYTFVVSGWAQYVMVDLSAYKNIAAFRERVAARPAVQAALKADGSIR